MSTEQKTRTSGRGAVTYLLIIILHTSSGYEQLRVQYVRDRRVVAARCEVRR